MPADKHEPIWGVIQGSAYPDRSDLGPRSDDVIVRLESSPDIDEIGGELDITFGFRRRYGEQVESFGLVAIYWMPPSSKDPATAVASLKAGALEELVALARQKVEADCLLNRFFGTEDSRATELRRSIQMTALFYRSYEGAQPDEVFKGELRKVLALANDLNPPVDVIARLAKQLDVPVEQLHAWAN